MEGVEHTKTAPEKDSDFIEINRAILGMIGFKNTFSELRDKNGNIKLDKNGQPKLKDMRNDFSHATKYLRNTAGFIEGDSLDDKNANFVIKKTGNLSTSGHGGSGWNKKTIWVRKNMLDKWIDIVMFSGKFNHKKNKASVYSHVGISL